MIRSETQLTIERPAVEVWAYAADVVRHPDWMGVTSATLLRGDGSGVGSRGRERLVLGPFSWDVEFEVAEAVPGRRIVWRSVTGAPFDLEVALDLQAASETSTQATYGAAIQPHGLWRLLSPLLAMEGKAGPEREIRRLKENLETAAAPVGAVSREGGGIVTLEGFPIHATAAASDLTRARAWYEQKLGLVPERENPGGVWYRFSGETWLYLYETSSAGTARNTVAGWTVTGIEAVMAALHERGVAFEDYDFGDLKTVEGLADFGSAKAAWFKDSEGNTFELSEVL